MMAGELNYEETFSADSFYQQILFLVFVFLLTIMLNNLVIGMTTSNVEELMKEARDEKLNLMVDDICNFYPKGKTRKYVLDKLTSDLTINVTIKPPER